MIHLVLAALAAVSTTVASPAPAGPPNCSAPEYRALDFWAGDWDIDFDASPGVIGHAFNHVTKDEQGDCVVAEHFQLPATHYTGASYSIYDRRLGQWRQTWVDNQGAVFVLTGGPVKGQPFVFELRTIERTGAQNTIMRMTWSKDGPDRLTWRWQAQQPDGSWQDSWVLRYRRHGAPG